MVKDPQIRAIQKDRTPSVLDGFQLSFEYNKTLQEIKREVRTRTI